jgi:hypothetical protein
VSRTRAVGVSDLAPGTTIADIAILETGSPDQTTTTTADPGTGGATLAVASAARFPTSNNFKIKVDSEIMVVTAGAGTTTWTVTRAQDGTTAATHATGSLVALLVGMEVVTSSAPRQTICTWATTSFRTLGSAASGQNIFSLENQAAAKVNLAVRWLRMEMDATAVLTAVALDMKTGRTTALPTGGTALPKVLFNTSQASAATSVARGATASDGGAATAIAATLAATAWHQYGMRMPTQVGQMLPDDWNLLPQITDDTPFILQPGQGLAVQVVGTAASNAATNHYVVKALVEEYMP